MKFAVYLFSLAAGNPLPQFGGQPGFGSGLWQGCPQGQVWQNGRCISQNWQGCPQGQTWQNGSCQPQCPIGQHWEAWQRRCVQNFNGNTWQPGTGNRNCVMGQIWNGSQCVQSQQCQPGFVSSPQGCIRQTVQINPGNPGWQGVTGPGSPTIIRQNSMNPTTAAKEQEVYYILGWQVWNTGFNVDSHVRSVVRYLDRKNVQLNPQLGVIDQVLQSIVNLAQYSGQTQLNTWKVQVVQQAQQTLNRNGYSNSSQAVKFHYNARRAMGRFLNINTQNGRQQVINQLNNVYTYINTHPVGQLNSTHALDNLLQQVFNLRQYINSVPTNGQDPLINGINQLQRTATNAGYTPITGEGDD